MCFNTLFAGEMAPWSWRCPHTIIDNQVIGFVVAIKYLYRSLSQ